MTLLNTMNPQYPTRQENKADRELKELTAEVDSILSVIDDIVALNIDYTTTTPQDVQKNIASEVKQQNNKIQKLRSRILSEKMLISKSSSVFSVYQDGKKNNAMDVYSVIGSCPRVQVSELKEVADKLGFCIFNEKVFNEENNAKNANIAEEAAIQLREKGYKIYYLSPLSGFDYASFIKSGSGVYDILSYWGNHLQTFNTLALSLNVFRDLYSIVDSLKKENEEIRKAIDSDRDRVRAFHEQFKQYVTHVNNNLRIIEAPLNHYIDQENKKHMDHFNKVHSEAVANNEKYKNNRYERIEYFKVYDKKTGNHEGDYSDLSYFMFDDYDDYRYVNAVEYRDRFLPVPQKAFQYKNFYASQFNVKELSTEKEIKRFQSNYTIANIKKIIQSELGNNYMMLAIKGDVMNPEQENAIVLSTWGQGISEETMIALGVKNV